jgi:plastocyanin
MRHLHSFSLSLLAAGLTLSPAAASRQATETGTISGHVKLTTRVPGARLPTNAYPTRSVGRRSVPAIPEIQNVVVYLKGVTFRGTLPVVTAELKQQDEAFVPHVLAITQGSTVSFPNADPFFHNVFSLSSAASFNLGRYSQGHTQTQRFTKPGLVKVYCDIHSHMSATIMVLDHPYFAIPDADGTFALRDVPAGQYTIVGWHERVGERTLPLRVESGKTTSVDFTLPVEEPK